MSLEVVMSEGMKYGYGLFETIRFQNQMPQSLEAHYDRLKQSASALMIDYSTDYETFKKDIINATSQSELKNGALRYQISKSDSGIDTTIRLQANRYTKEMYREGFRICISDVHKSSKSLLIHHKSVNYLENLLILRNAKAQNFDEALLINELGQITEGTYTNVFAVKDKVLYTPDLKCGLLPGTMRQTVINAALNEGIEVRLVQAQADDFLDCEELFITNALMGIMPVRNVGNQTKIFDTKHNVITKKLSEIVMANWIY